MKRTDVIIIGGGQAGLAMSRHLAVRGIDHVVLERGRVAERWRTERWDSLRLLTPNWFSRLPDWRYRGPDPDGFMTMAETVRYFEDYARSIVAPVETGTSVRSLTRANREYSVDTNRGEWRARCVVIATGAADTPIVPEMAWQLPGSISQVTPTRYRNPGQLPDGGVLVVGAAASGVQLAEELRMAGRAVTLAVGRHTRLPRRYRGRDIFWWLEKAGVWEETVDQVRDLHRSRHEPSLQLVGNPDNRSIDLARLQAEGVRIVGRAAAIDGARMRFAGDLAATTGAAEEKLRRLLGRIDDFAAASGLGEEGEAVTPILLEGGDTTIDLKAEGISTVLWATGFRRRYPWLQVPVLDRHGEIAHRDGFTPSPGLYVLGMKFQHRRKSNFIDGVGEDAAILAGGIEERLGVRPRIAA